MLHWYSILHLLIQECKGLWKMNLEVCFQWQEGARGRRWFYFHNRTECLGTSVCQQFGLYCIISFFIAETVFSAKDSEKPAQYYQKIKNYHRSHQILFSGPTASLFCHAKRPPLSRPHEACLGVPGLTWVIGKLFSVPPLWGDAVTWVGLVACRSLLIWWWISTSAWSLEEAMELVVAS